MLKKRKTIVSILLAVMVAFALCACGSDSDKKESEDSGGAPVEKEKDESSSGDSSAEEKEDSGDADNGFKTGSKKFKTSKDGKVTILESGYGINESGTVTAGALLANKNSEKAFEYFGINVTAYAEDGSVVGTEEDTQSKIQPGEIRPFCTTIYDDKKKVKKVEIEVVEGDEIAADSDAVKSQDLSVSNISETDDKDMDWTEYTGILKNNGKKDIEDGYVIVLLKKKGKIVGAGYESGISVKKGSKKAFELTTDGIFKHDKYEAYGFSEDI